MHLLVGVVLFLAGAMMGGGVSTVLHWALDRYGPPRRGPVRQPVPVVPQRVSLTEPVSIQDTGPIVTTMGAEFEPLVASYLQKLHQQTTDVRTAILQGDRVTALATIHKIKGAAGSYGFPSVTDAAARLERAVDAGAPPKSVHQLIARLESLVGRTSSCAA